MPKMSHGRDTTLSNNYRCTTILALEKNAITDAQRRFQLRHELRRG